ncbi:GNAT family N-acetyltransferase [Pseudoxanthobacter sp.]|uniref:GNAT family N-acetyltransferase n=1 Tax=Pseudoxanthobacter sp. TaxID=1925742 RepID=UPI002FE3FDB0
MDGGDKPRAADGPALRLRLTDAPPEAARVTLAAGIVAFNAPRVGLPRGRPLAVLLEDSDGTVAGGLLGRTSYEWLYIELLFVPEAARGCGTGAELVRRALAEARGRGAVGAWVDTFGARTAAFYQRLGFTVFGTLEDHPPGNTRYFLKQRLDGAAQLAP